jgi:hypothetical protein
MYHPKICIGGLNETTGSLLITDALAEIQTEYLLNTNLECYCYTSMFREQK